MKYRILELSWSKKEPQIVDGGEDFFICPKDNEKVNIQCSGEIRSGEIPNVPQICPICKSEFGIKGVINESDVSIKDEDNEKI